MTVMFVTLPLHSDEDYQYTIALEKVAYNIRLYYNFRMEQWVMDLRYANNEPLVLGVAIVPNYPMLVDYILPLSGMFWLEPIGKKQNETITNPFELNKYYNFFYIYDDGE